MFAKHTCPNCKTGKMVVDKAGIKYETIFADEPENREITLKHKVTRVPTLFVPTKEGGYEVFENAMNIKAFIERK